jgi:hypothetical protein
VGAAAFGLLSLTHSFVIRHSGFVIPAMTSACPVVHGQDKISV